MRSRKFAIWEAGLRSDYLLLASQRSLDDVGLEGGEVRVLAHDRIRVPLSRLIEKLADLWEFRTPLTKATGDMTRPYIAREP